MVVAGTHYDQGSAAPYNILSAIDGPATSHDITITGLSAITPTHLSILAQSENGYGSYLSDQVVA